jgi:hypothetical protein
MVAMRLSLTSLPVWAALAAVLLVASPGGAEEGEEPAPPGNGAPPEEDEEDPKAEEADEPVPFVEEVNQAIDRGVEWLLARPEFFTISKTPVAHWGLIRGTQIYGGGTGKIYQHPAGPTALALYTLLKCGVDPKHPTIVEGFNWLRTPHEITTQYDGESAPAGFSWNHKDRLVPGSYELSAMILALTAKYDTHKRTKNTQAARRKGKLRINDKDELEWLQDMVASLAERRGHPKPDEVKREDKLGWRYNTPTLTLSRGSGRGGTQSATREGNPGHISNQDLSSTQLAALALFSAHQFGVKVDRDVWLDIVEFTLAHQEETGPEHKRHDPVYSAGGYSTPTDHARGFCYIRGSPEGSEGKATGSMTACGLASLLMAKNVLVDDKRGEAEWTKRGYDKKVETAIWDGLAWLDLNWSSFTNPHSRYGYHIYFCYCVERTMDLLSKNLVGKHLWYTEMGREILNRDQPAKVKVRTEKNRETDGVFWLTGDTHDPKDVLDTCFALLFLKRATKGMVPGGVVTGGDGAPVDNR